MSILDVINQKKLAASFYDARLLVFNREIKVNGQIVNSVYHKINIGDIVKIHKYEILVCKRGN